MAEFRLPEGRYLSCNVMVKPGSGGQTRAMLQRNRIFHEEAGVSPAILAFDPATDYAERRQALIDDDLITADMCLLNMYDYYHAGSAVLDDPLGEKLAGISGHATSVEHYPDGSPFRTVYADRLSGQPVGYDYHRIDGTVFARTVARGGKLTMGGPRVRLVNPGGEVARAFSTLSEWYRHWMQELTAGDQRVFAFVDSRFVLPHLVPMRSRRFYMIYVLHNIHVRGERHWNSDIPPVYQNVFKRIRHLDALVTLTARQGEDLAQRFGATNNLFVVPNPIRSPVPPDPPLRRDPHRLAAVGRLGGQKGFGDAIQAMAIIRDRVPTARLDIYGEGNQREALTDLIARLDLAEAVTLHGHVVGARDRLWTAAALLMPSRFEGYPLASLESLAHGCPVIAYDIKYGPREQISPGVDGFLVPPRDFHTLARRAIEVLTEPDLAARLSAGALRKAELHGPAAFLADWREVLEGVLALRDSRTQIRDVSLDVRGLGGRRSPEALFRWLASLPPTRRTVASAPPTQVTFTATLRVDGRSAKATLHQAVISLDAISKVDGAVTAVPLNVRLTRDSLFRLSSTFDPADVLARLGPLATSLELRLRLTWQNSSWETFLTPAAGGLRAKVPTGRTTKRHLMGGGDRLSTIPALRLQSATLRGLERRFSAVLERQVIRRLLADLPNPSRHRLSQWVRKAAAVGKSKSFRVLDAGAGRAPYRHLFDHVTYETADFVQVSRKKYTEIDHVCDLTKIPVPDETYDLVLSTQVLEHVPEPVAVLREFHRVLKPGGQAWLSAPLFYAEHEKPFDFHRYTQFSWRWMAADSGFRVEVLDWLEGYYGTLAYQASMGAHVLPGRWVLWRVVLALLARHMTKAEMRRKIKVGMPKNYCVVLVKEPAATAPGT